MKVLVTMSDASLVSSSSLTDNDKESWIFTKRKFFILTPLQAVSMHSTITQLLNIPGVRSTSVYLEFVMAREAYLAVTVRDQVTDHGATMHGISRKLICKKVRDAAGHAHARKSSTLARSQLCNWYVTRAYHCTLAPYLPAVVTPHARSLKVPLTFSRVKKHVPPAKRSVVELLAMHLIV
eukprot:g25237.t1